MIIIVIFLIHGLSMTHVVDLLSADQEVILKVSGELVRVVLPGTVELDL